MIATTTIPSAPPSFPVRPMNGGKPTLARKIDPESWVITPKLDGYRVIVHAPTVAMWNRHGQRLSSESDYFGCLTPFKDAARLGFEWLDCEGISRRHDHSKGSMVILDWMGPSLTHAERRERLESLDIPILDEKVEQPAGSVTLVPMHPWKDLARYDAFLRTCVGFEGLVARRSDSTYRFQTGSSTKESTEWTKHRWV